MQNYVSSGKTVTIPAPRDVLSGELVAVGELAGFAQTNASQGDLVAIVTEGVYTVEVTAAAAVTIGMPVYLADGALTTDAEAEGAVKIGVAVSEGEAGAAQLHVKIG